ncbi:MAG: hypothetical protein H7833_14380 [Magnetococcus sp. DMHC-1]|nr:hypothetical protein [Magnetococcales bacterium]
MINYECKDKKLHVITLSEKSNFIECNEVLNLIEKTNKDGYKYIIDLSKLQSIDSKLIGILLYYMNNSKERKYKISMRNARNGTYRTLVNLGLLHKLNITSCFCDIPERVCRICNGETVRIDPFAYRKANNLVCNNKNLSVIGDKSTFDLIVKDQNKEKKVILNHGYHEDLLVSQIGICEYNLEFFPP